MRFIAKMTGPPLACYDERPRFGSAPCRRRRSRPRGSRRTRSGGALGVRDPRQARTQRDRGPTPEGPLSEARVEPITQACRCARRPQAPRKTASKVSQWSTCTTVTSHATAANTPSRCSTHSRSNAPWTLGGRRHQSPQHRSPTGFPSPSGSDRGTRWTLGGRRGPNSSPAWQTKGAGQQELRKSPLTDSNR
jgi:hypothetical protein